MSPTPVPATIRLTAEDEEALSRLPGNRSDIIRRGIHLQADALATGKPLYPVSVDTASVKDIVERAAAAAVRELDALFPQAPPESAGISSNFQGFLAEQLSAMLMGHHTPPRRSTRAVLTPLFGDFYTFGKPVYPGDMEGIALMKVADRLGTEPEFLDTERGRVVKHEELRVGDLFTSSEAAVDAAYAWLFKNKKSPREFPLRLCLMAIPDQGPPALVKIAEA